MPKTGPFLWFDNRCMKARLTMKKIVIAQLQRAYGGNV